ncbi:unnamed protein product [Symbiodinium natans]|uniref:Uncharacterized protein n=1 Tax=Symbiodinium natans TaxID=878477 RepID=A0A812MU91_9DINO|nr:unnamed protein product [Symbiodinium natans]
MTLAVDDLTEIVKQNAKSAEEALSRVKEDGQADVESAVATLRNEVMGALTQEEEARNSGHNHLDAGFPAPIQGLHHPPADQASLI